VFLTVLAGYAVVGLYLTVAMVRRRRRRPRQRSIGLIGSTCAV